MKKPSRRPRPTKRAGKSADDIVVYRPGMKDRTDWEAVKRMTDEDIDRQIAENPDAAPAIDESWMADAEVVFPEKKTAIHIRLDNDILDFFKQSGGGYQTKINAVLRGYVQANRRPLRRRSTRQTKA